MGPSVGGQDWLVDGLHRRAMLVGGKGGPSCRGTVLGSDQIELETHLSATVCFNLLPFRTVLPLSPHS